MAKQSNLWFQQQQVGSNQQEREIRPTKMCTQLQARFFERTQTISQKIYISGCWFGTMEFYMCSIHVMGSCHNPWRFVHHFSEGWLNQQLTMLYLIPSHRKGHGFGSGRLRVKLRFINVYHGYTYSIEDPNRVPVEGHRLQGHSVVAACKEGVAV